MPRSWLPLILFLLALCNSGHSQINLDIELDDSAPRSSDFSAGPGYMNGNYEYFIHADESTMSSDQIGKDKYSIGGIKFTYTRTNGAYLKGTIGLRISAGNIQESKRYENASSFRETGTRKQYSINPYCSYDWRNIGISAGFHVGKFYSLNKAANFLPQMGMRLGPYDIFYLDMFIADHDPGSFPAPLLKVGFGTGIGRNDGTAIKIGLSSYAGFYVSGRVIIQSRLVVEVFFGHADIGGPPSDFMDFDFISGDQVSINMQYRFGLKNK